jgi:hypothetical protein
MRQRMMNKRVDEHSFSIEMKTEQSVRRMSFSDKENDQIIFEGYLGELTKVSMVEGVMLEIVGNNGVLRLDIKQQEIEKCLIQNRASLQGGVEH